MKRRFVKLVVFLLLGAIVNVAVAWGCALWAAPVADMRMTGDEMLQQPPRDWVVVKWSAFGTEFVISGIDEFKQAEDVDWTRTQRSSSIAPGWLRPRQPHPGLYLAFDGRGYPMIALWCLRPHSKSMMDAIPVAGTWRLWGTPMERLLPLRPAWPGFVINTLFYAAILWGFFAAPFALRRRFRINRGLCPACAYPIGESDVCTECGKPVKPEAGV